ncbi:MAG: hypothetical protein OEW37_10825 [Rhodospirillaceae bacterium]|nr:hypothetical protein [Rhodospirillaceae bacterium]
MPRNNKNYLGLERNQTKTRAAFRGEKVMSMSAQVRAGRVAEGVAMGMRDRMAVAFLRNGQEFIAKVLGISSTEAHRKMNNESGFKFDQIAELFDALGLQIVDRDQFVLTKEKYHALVAMAQEQLTSELETVRGVQRRTGKVVPLNSEGEA